MNRRGWGMSLHSALRCVALIISSLLVIALPAPPRLAACLMSRFDETLSTGWCSGRYQVENAPSCSPTADTHTHDPAQPLHSWQKTAPKSTKRKLDQKSGACGAWAAAADGDSGGLLLWCKYAIMAYTVAYPTNTNTNSGGGRKPRPQKNTGRSRHGSIR